MSSLTSEAEAEAEMLVYSPVEEMEFMQRRLSGEAWQLDTVLITKMGGTSQEVT